MNRDRYDLPLTTASDRAAAHYRDGVDRVLSAWYGAARPLTGRLPTIPILRWRISPAPASTSSMPKAPRRGPRRACPATRRQRHERERRHVEITAAAIEGQPGLALTGAEAYLEQFPRDALVLGMLLGAFGLYAFSGRADHDAAKLAICERHAGHYGEDWWFLTYLGWSHSRPATPAPAGP